MTDWKLENKLREKLRRTLKEPKEHLRRERREKAYTEPSKSVGKRKNMGLSYGCLTRLEECAGGEFR